MICKGNEHEKFIIKSDVYIKLKYIRISLDLYQHIFDHVQHQKKEENNISTMKTYQMLNKWQYLICIKVSFSNQNMQNDIVTSILQYINDNCIIIHNYKTGLDYFC